MSLIFKKIKYMVKPIIVNYPWLYFPLLHILNSPRKDLHVRKDTDIVIEGYPRSANTYAVCAFLFAQKKPVKIARHLHSPSQIIQAARWGIPTLVIIRNPKDAIASLLVREPALSAKRAIKDYISFYKTVEKFRSKIVIATFEVVISDFARVINAVNDKFGTNFYQFINSEDNIKQVWKMVDDMDKIDQGQKNITITTVARPIPNRKQLKQEKLKELNNTGILLKKAEEIYKSLIDTAEVR